MSTPEETPEVTSEENDKASLKSDTKSERSWTWKRVSNRQWVRNFRSYATRLYSLPYTTISCCKGVFLGTGYYPDMIDYDSYHNYTQKYPVSTRKMSLVTGEDYVPGQETDISSSMIPSTTDVSTISLLTSLQDESDTTDTGDDSNANINSDAAGKRKKKMSLYKPVAGTLDRLGAQTRKSLAMAERARKALGKDPAPHVDVPDPAKGKKDERNSKGGGGPPETTEASASETSLGPPEKGKGKKGSKVKKDFALEAETGFRGGAAETTEASASETSLGTLEKRKAKKGSKGKKDSALEAETGFRGGAAETTEASASETSIGTLEKRKAKKGSKGKKDSALEAETGFRGGAAETTEASASETSFASPEKGKAKKGSKGKKDSVRENETISESVFVQGDVRSSRASIKFESLSPLQSSGKKKGGGKTK